MSSEVNFCPKCGEKRIKSAKFCVSCGHAFGGGPTGNMTHTLIGLAAVVVLTGITWFGVDRMLQREAAEEASHNHGQHGHGQGPETDPHLASMEEAAKSGAPEALMELAEHQIDRSAQDPAYLEKAMHTLERLLNSYPNHAYTLRLLGNVCYNLRESEKAAEYYRRYLEIYPDDANVITDRATQLLALERDEEAIASYKRAIELYPNFYNAHFNLAIAYEHTGNEEKAEEYKAKAEAIRNSVGTAQPPIRELSRLPEGAAQPASTSGRYAGLESFFKQHPIISPKISGFKVEDDVAKLIVSAFPMDQMPANMRESLGVKIQAQLAQCGPGAKLEIIDGPSSRVMANYSNDGSASAPQKDVGRYAGLEDFFRSHQIIGPKISDFHVKDDVARLVVNGFPMDRMPQTMRDSLGVKIIARLEEVGENARLEIVDNADGKVMAQYPQ